MAGFSPHTHNDRSGYQELWRTSAREPSEAAMLWVWTFGVVSLLKHDA